MISSILTLAYSPIIASSDNITSENNLVNMDYFCSYSNFLKVDALSKSFMISSVTKTQSISRAFFAGLYGKDSGILTPNFNYKLVFVNEIRIIPRYFVIDKYFSR